MQESKMIELANELLRSARSGNLAWEEDSEEDGYTVDFPDVSLSIVSQGNNFALELINAEGETIESLRSAVAPQVWETLKEIFELARRQAWDIDGNISKALQYLRRR